MTMQQQPTARAEYLRDYQRTYMQARRGTSETPGGPGAAATETTTGR
jgi:hypothetical protein